MKSPKPSNWTWFVHLFGTKLRSVFHHFVSGLGMTLIHTVAPHKSHQAVGVLQPVFPSEGLRPQSNFASTKNRRLLTKPVGPMLFVALVHRNQPNSTRWLNLQCRQTKSTRFRQVLIPNVSRFIPKKKNIFTDLGRSCRTQFGEKMSGVEK